MNLSLRLVPFNGLLLLLGLFSAAISPAFAQTSPEAASSRPASPEDLSQSELLRSYLQLREQLHATQLAVVNSRAETEAAARVQATALTERLDAIKAMMDAERERHRSEAQRAAADRERQESAAQSTNRTFLWIAVVFGGLGLLAMLLTPLFQWRAINRLAEGVAARAALPSLAPPATLPAAAADEAVAASNQRLISVIDRVEKRVLDLEQTTSRQPAPPPVSAVAAPVSAQVPSGPSSTTSPFARVEVETQRKPAAPQPLVEQDPRITLLLGKGRLLLGSNKARDALTCYDEILQIDVNHSEALVKKGSALERLKRDEEAIWCYDRAIEANRKMTLAYLYKGGVFNRQGRYDDALECYEQALQTAEES